MVMMFEQLKIGLGTHRRNYKLLQRRLTNEALVIYFVIFEKTGELGVVPEGPGEFPGVEAGEITEVTKYR